LLLHPGSDGPVIGASGAICAMMGGVMRFLFAAIDEGKGALLREEPSAIPLMPLSQAVKDRRVIWVTVAFIAMNLLAIVGFGNFGVPGTIAWEAHVGGYLFGLLAFGLFDIAPQNTSPHLPNFQ
jgi:membrane associated rhomboid family serine protease